MKQYLDLLRSILETGSRRSDRTGVGTRSLFGPQLEFDLNDGFPAMTTKKLAWKSVVSELLWFLEGSGDERRLAEILYQEDRTKLLDKTTIWTANANSDYWKHKAAFDGDAGRIYGLQWRSWTSSTGHVDQINTLIQGIKEDPYSRRHIVNAWNPGELNNMALPPCHMMFQCWVNDNKLSLKMYQRSADAPLGVPFNIASYALLTHMLAHVTGLQVGKLIITFGDVHIYENQIDGIVEQLKREPKKLPTLKMNTEKTSIDEFVMDDFELIDYEHWPAIKMKMAV